MHRAILIDEYALVLASEFLRREQVPEIARAAMRRSFARTIVLDLSRVRDATIEAFADLIILRRRLLRDKRDLRLSGLHDRAARIYEINRLHKILPQREIVWRPMNADSRR